MSASGDGQATTVEGSGGEEAERPAIRAWLCAVHPPGLRWSLTLEGEGEEVKIGRGVGGAAQIDHATVSRQHVALRWDAEAGAHGVRDLGSRNGARVDGARLGDRPVALEDGSVVQLGDVMAIYERGGVGAGERSAIRSTSRGAVEVAVDVNEDVNDDDEDVNVDVNEGSEERTLVAALPGRSAAMRALRALVRRAAPDPSPVLITGETGTGKEWIARAVHLHSGRRGPLVAVNCAALGRELLESQLFGHVRGAFTGAAADSLGLFRAAEGGTLFLDELGELPLELQPKLLRALQEREVLPVGATRPIKIDVRVCAATNRDLAAAVEHGELRRDLYARLALWELEVPPLRARRVDVLAWLARLYHRWCAERGRAYQPLELSPAAVEAILLHPWPDNLRGLDRLVHALASHRAGAPLQRHELPAWLIADASPPTAAAAAARSASIARANPPASPTAITPAGCEATRPPTPSREELCRAYAELNGNVRALARHFRRDRRQIYRWLDAHSLVRREAE